MKRALCLIRELDGFIILPMDSLDSQKDALKKIALTGHEWMRFSNELASNFVKVFVFRRF